MGTIRGLRRSWRHASSAAAGVATAAVTVTTAATIAMVASTAGAGVVGGGFGTGGAGGSSPFMLTELRVDQSGADNDEYFEVYGASHASLAGWWFLALGDSASDAAGVVEMAINLSAYSCGGNGYFVGHEATFGNTTFAGRTLAVDPAAAHAVIGTGDSLNFENADTVTYMLVRGFTGSVGMDLDAGNDGVLDLAPWLELGDAVAFVRSGTRDPIYCSNFVGPIDLTATGGMPPHAWRDGEGWHPGLYSAWDADSPGFGAFVPAPGALALLAGAAVSRHGYHRRRRE